MSRRGHSALMNMLADVRLDATQIIPELMKQPIQIQERFVELFVAYIRAMAVQYRYGYFPNNTQNIAVLCARLNECGLDHFARLPEYEYGDILEDA